eukprot:TRINITY_DN49347_c0_g1_i1.p1 TRINITY_DN49347_c0_g1~~TRINITY_DN49347_c0_g1_i1.p1  ORF type:complete len:1128 (+),score=177.76 TRINITY_DN49347_c0_g1_i1:32-3385(+)
MTDVDAASAPAAIALMAAQATAAGAETTRRGRWGRGSCRQAAASTGTAVTQGAVTSERPAPEELLTAAAPARSSTSLEGGVPHVTTHVTEPEGVPNDTAQGCVASSGMGCGSGGRGCSGGATDEVRKRIVYTIGTWRVSREIYLWQFGQLGVKLLVDVRGNPRAGREELLHRGKDFTKALLTVGVRYEYWGDRFGEDQVEAENEQDLSRLLKGLLASAPTGHICLLGHLHEPYKCHRLHLCSLFAATSCRVVHLMWEDHRSLRTFSHAEAAAKHQSAVEYFFEEKDKERQRRLCERQKATARASVAKHDSAPGTSDTSAAAVAAAATAAAAEASSLPTLFWEATSECDWQERLRDGKAYRLRLPWDTELLWYPRFLDTEAANDIERTIQDRITMYHATYRFQTPSGIVQETVNRKGQARLCDNFKFSVQYNTQKDTKRLYDVEKLEPWSTALLRRVEAASESVFNTVWFNHYTDGTVTIHWHTDSDEGLGPNPIIGSVSVGATRDFCFKSKRAWIPASSGARHSGGTVRTAATAAGGILHLTLPLFHGSLVVMGRNSQTHWLHAVPAMEGVHRERTNLTFRFYALEGLAVNGGNGGSREEASPAASAAACATDASATDVTADVSQEGPCRPERVRLLLEAEHWRHTSIRPRTVLVDAPMDPSIKTSEFARRISENVLPDGAPAVRLAVAKPSTGDAAGRSRGPEALMIQDEEPFFEELVRCEADSCVNGTVDLRVFPSDSVLLTQSLASPPPSKVASSSSASPTPVDLWSAGSCCSWPGMLATGGLSAIGELRRELEDAPPGPYVPPRAIFSSTPGSPRGAVPVPADGDWVREVIQNLSGIQRRSKGKGQLSQWVFHQSSEFVALYVCRPKSTVHVLVSPRRFLRRCDISSSEAPLVNRMACYAAYLARCLSARTRASASASVAVNAPAGERPLPLLFAAGLRVRPSRVQQFHGHLISMDLAAPRTEDLERRHFEDFTGGPSRFMSLEEVACSLAVGGVVPSGITGPATSIPTFSAAASVGGAATATKSVAVLELRCHRCGHRFGDASKELARHLGRCLAWPTHVEEGAPSKKKECTDNDVELLEEMGFGNCGREALLAALAAAGGSLEGAVSALVR